MAIKLTEQQLRTILALREIPERDSTYVILGEKLGVDTQTASRTVKALAGMGLCSSTMSRHPTLSDEGIAVSDEYAKRVREKRRFLEYKGIERIEAENYAIKLCLMAPDELYDKIFDIPDKFDRLKTETTLYTEMTGAELCQKLKKYSSMPPFEIYKYSYGEHQLTSMADDGFRKPCRFEIEKGVGNIVMTGITVRRHGVTGKARKLWYYSSNMDFVQAEQNGDDFYIPVKDVKFTLKNDDIKRREFFGMILLRFETTVEIQEMKNVCAWLVLHL